MESGNTAPAIPSGTIIRMDAEETAFPALDALDDPPKLNPELVAWANTAAAINAEAVEKRRRTGRGLAFVPRITEHDKRTCNDNCFDGIDVTATRRPE